MPFTALHPDAGHLDATQPDLGCAMDWAQIYRVRPRVPLACPGCGWAVHAKYSPQGVRFFCHDPGRDGACELAGESWEHHMLKLELASAVRSAGWHAALEVAGGDGAWRADVMASSPDGSRHVAWEAQLSPITDRDILARTGRYAAEGIGVCWVSPGPQPPPWIDVVPAVRVSAPDGHGQRWRVVDGLGGFDAAAGNWEFKRQELGRFVRWVLSDSITPIRSLPHYTSVQRGLGSYVQRRLWWTSAQSERAQSEHDRRRREKADRADKARQEAADRRAARQRQEHQRQQQLQRRRKSQPVTDPEDEETRRARKQAQRHQEQERRPRHEQEAAERKELAGRALETARAWWQNVPPQQRAQLFAAVVERAWHDEEVRVEIPERPRVSESFAYGIPLYTMGRLRTLYGIVRPCPELVFLSPQLEFQHVVMRDEQEARQLAGVMSPRARITHLGLSGDATGSPG
ncbi:competence protein CoiA family protein [Streptomyces sp. NPDC059697]|uniref:competence protein CoiA family protein n=1 Tax=Streptomyces sp. NPDC059697 TaxID=3346912 RepID=UPI0036A07E83